MTEELMERNIKILKKINQMASETSDLEEKIFLVKKWFTIVKQNNLDIPKINEKQVELSKEEIVTEKEFKEFRTLEGENFNTISWVKLKRLGYLENKIIKLLKKLEKL